MDHPANSWFSICLPECHLKSLPLPSTQPAPSTRRLSSMFSSLAATVKSILPRRRLEPTSPLVLLFDMLLSIFVPRGACRSVIDKLPLVIVGESSPSAHALCKSSSAPVLDEKCSICLGPYERGDPVRRLGCNHAFHAECVDMWLEKRSLCPICKVDPC